MKTLPFALAALTLLLGGCDRIDAWRHPYDETAPVHSVPPAPDAKAGLSLYPSPQGGVSLQSRPGNCDKVVCYILVKGRWKPLSPTDYRGLGLLSVDSTTGGAYREDLWRPVGRSGNGVLVNSEVAANNVARGIYDGPRIGLRRGSPLHYTTTYATAFAFETKDGKLRLTPQAVSIYIAADKVWLLHVRADGSANLVDLLAAGERTDPLYCLPGLFLDTRPIWAGPVEKALSPDIFVSRAIDPAQAASEKQMVDTCAAHNAGN